MTPDDRECRVCPLGRCGHVEGAFVDALKAVAVRPDHLTPRWSPDFEGACDDWLVTLARLVAARQIGNGQSRVAIMRALRDYHEHDEIARFYELVERACADIGSST